LVANGYSQRKHISTTPLYLDPSRLQDVVEKFLVIFCTDPLAPPPPIEEPMATPGPSGLVVPTPMNERTNPFDAPSASRRNITNTNTPMQESANPFDAPSGGRRGVTALTVGKGNMKKAETSTGSPVLRRHGARGKTEDADHDAIPD
jgi:hypothetical protein